MKENEVNLVLSAKNRAVLVDGYRFEIEIYRLDDQDCWTLDVIDIDGASYVWDEKFAFEEEALAVAIDVLHTEGALVFMGKDSDTPPTN